MATAPTIHDLGDMSLPQVETWLDEHHIPEPHRSQFLAEAALSIEIKQWLEEAAKRAAAGEVITAKQLSATLSEIAQRHGCEAGIPMPAIREGNSKEYPLVLARRAPLAHVIAVNQAATEAEARLRHRDIPIRNSWRVLGDMDVCVVDTEQGPMWMPEYHAGIRLRKIMAALEVRTSAPHFSAEAELRAMDSLRTKISNPQWETYVLNGCFVESSKRSGLFYIFRKGLPTLALSFHGDANRSGRVIAALCLHPMGYYQFTHCGVMTPTDEVIAHLLLMRSDEHGFWKKSGQWSAEDTRSGL